MTRKELITACVENQIERGVIPSESKAFQIKARLSGMGGLKAMSKAECLEWYQVTFKK